MQGGDGSEVVTDAAESAVGGDGPRGLTTDGTGTALDDRAGSLADGGAPALPDHHERPAADEGVQPDDETVNDAADGERARAVAIISPIRWWWKWWLRLTWPGARPSRFIARPLVELSFIHFAHWSLVTRMPQGASRRRSKPLPHPYLLFQTNFSDDLVAYIDAFALVVPWRIRGIWTGAYRFPGPQSPDKFLAFIQENLAPDIYYFCAYPEASVSMIRTALALVIRHDRLIREAKRLDGPAFASRVKSLVAEPAIASSLTQRASAPTALIVLAPVREGHEDELRQSIKAIPEGEDNPFAGDAGTHFARVTVIPALLDGNGEPTVPTRAYLLIGADFDGSVGNWLKRVNGKLRASLDPVLLHCEGYPGAHEAAPFDNYLLEHTIPPGFSVISYRATVAEVRYAVELQRNLRKLAFSADGLGEVRLREVWEKECAPRRRECSV